MTEVKRVDLDSLIAGEQALRGALWRGGKRKESQCNCVSEILIPPPCGIPSTELVDFRQSARRENELECKQTLKNTWKHASIARLIFNVISANQHFTRLFSMQKFKFQRRRSCKFSFLFLPHRQSPPILKLSSEKNLKSFAYIPDNLSKRFTNLHHLILKFQKFSLDHLYYVFYPGYQQFFETENPARSESPSSVSRENIAWK